MVLAASVSVLAALAAALVYVDLIGDDGRVNVFEALSVAPFVLLFGWITLSFVLAMVGAGRVVQNADAAAATPSEPWGRDPELPPVAVLMPVYNENPRRVLAGVEAMIRGLEHAGALGSFEFYLLSDSTDPDVWLREEWQWAALCRRQPDAAIRYRHRPKNHCRKAGNIEDFCERWGDHHDHMIVLDADSLMTPETMTAMVRAMDDDPQLGILQAPPRPIGRSSLLARVQQFASAVYGPIFVEGFDAWSGDQGNYWGHNAIIRIAAFKRLCELPVLDGDGPLGGEILSHDFVEAALMVRGGMKVRLASDLGGSYEECPTTIVDYAIRDNRWCQGNLQHLKLLVSEGFRGRSRWNFASGVMAYAASPIWVGFTGLCLAGLAWDRYRGVPLTGGSSAGIKAALLFAVSMAMLIVPKIVAAVIHRRRAGVVGRLRLAGSVLLEIVLSVLLSPIMAIYHTRFVVSTLAGRKVRWNAQQRDESGLDWGTAVRQFGGVTIGGVLLAGALYWLSPGLTLWFTPLLAGMWLSIPLAVAMASPRVGEWLDDRGYLTIPEEVDPPQVWLDCERLDREREGVDDHGSFGSDPFRRVVEDPAFYALHNRIQRDTESDTPIESHQRKAIEAQVAADGLDALPAASRFKVLADGATLKSLHLEAVVRAAGA